ncbi:MAG: putative ribonuclease YlaK [Algoriphagus sp.]|jgi:predicted ribonuclease YlaK
MDEDSYGLAYLIDKMKDQHLFSYIKLGCSELMNLANDLL